MAIGKSSMENQIKKAENIFLLTCTEISKIFNIKYLQWRKTDLSKKTKKKKKILRRDYLQISVAAILKCTVKNVSSKILPPVYFHIIKIDTK